MEIKKKDTKRKGFEDALKNVFKKLQDNAPVSEEESRKILEEYRKLAEEIEDSDELLETVYSIVRDILNSTD